jgi:hypothetical protein
MMDYLFNIKHKIKDVISFNMPPELAELKTNEIIKIIKPYLKSTTKKTKS